MIVINIMLVAGGFVYTNGITSERVKQNEEKIKSNKELFFQCEKKMERLDDITRRIELSVVRLESMKCYPK